MGKTTADYPKINTPGKRKILFLIFQTSQVYFKKEKWLQSPQNQDLIWNFVVLLSNFNQKWLTPSKMKMADLQVENFKRSITHTELTGAEIKSLPEETRLYESVGRMFMLSSRSEITGALDTKQENCKEKIKNLEANKTYLDRSLKDS